jgi:hypothetical protein
MFLPDSLYLETFCSDKARELELHAEQKIDSGLRSHPYLGEKLIVQVDKGDEMVSSEGLRPKCVRSALGRLHKNSE